MLKRYLSWLFLVACVCFFLGLGLKEAEATFSLSVTPYEGGYDLRFGKLIADHRVNEEVTVRITSDLGKQYRLISTLLDPLRTARGETIPRNSFVVYGIRGTNRYGRLSVEHEVPMVWGRTIIYTSNQQGLPDSFNLVYGLKVEADQAPGSYRGRIRYTLEPIDSEQRPTTVILNIFAEVGAEASIKIETAAGTRVVRLNSAKEEERSCDVLVDIRGGLGAQFRILQSLAKPLESPEGDRLSEEAVNFVAKGARKGTAIARATNLSQRQETIYTSGLRGAPDGFVITYSLGDLEKEKVGRYRSSIRYVLEGGTYLRPGLIDTLTLEVVNERVFNLLVQPETGGTILFRDLRPFEPPRRSEVTIQIETNTGSRYQVSQNVLSQFISKEGDVIPQEYFTLRMESLETKGTLKYPNKTQAELGSTVLFVSDKEGSPDSFKVIYELGIPLDLRAGDYSTRITYSLLEF